MTKTIFVFGSNLQGVHGKGAALHARQKHGAIHGIGEGVQGNAYAIPTKHTPYIPMTVDEIRPGVDRFLDHARQSPETLFLLTKIGCGLAGFSEDMIAPMFDAAPSNVVLVDDAGRPTRKAKDWSAAFNVRPQAKAA